MKGANLPFSSICVDVDIGLISFRKLAVAVKGPCVLPDNLQITMERLGDDAGPQSQAKNGHVYRTGLTSLMSNK